MTIKQSQSILVIVDSLNAEDSSGSKVNLAFINSLISEGFSVKVLALVVPKELELDAGVILVKPQMNIIYFLSRIQRRIQRLFNWNLSVFLENIFGFSFTFFNDANGILNGWHTYMIHILFRTIQPLMVLCPKALNRNTSFLNQ